MPWAGNPDGAWHGAGGAGTPVAVITGDGELMMNAGALATVASAAPQNLIIVCIDNGQHGETGGQPGHTSKRTNLTTLADRDRFRDDGFRPEDLSAARDFLADGIAPKFLWVRVARPAGGLQAQLGPGRMSLRFRLANADDA